MKFVEKIIRLKYITLNIFPKIVHLLVPSFSTTIVAGI